MIKVPHVAVFPNCLVQQKVLYPFRNQVTDNPCCVLSFQSCCQRGKEKQTKEVCTDHFPLQVGGTILAAKLAKERGWAINVGGGFHHCSGEKGGGFCAYADISLCIHFAFERLNISR